MQKTTVSAIVDKLGLCKYSWAVFLIISLCSLMSGVSYMIVSYTMSQIAADWSLSSVETGSLNSWTALGLIVGSAIGGAIADKFGRRKVLIVTVVAFSVLSGCMYFVPNFSVFAVLRVVIGFFMGMFMPLQVAYVGEFVPTKNRAVMIALGCCFMPLGYSLASVVSMLILPDFGWRAVYLVSFAGVILAIVAAVFFPESPNWLVANGRNKEAAIILNKMCKSAGKENEIKVVPDELVPALPQESDAAKETDSDLDKSKEGVKAIFSKKYAFATIGLWLMYFCAMLTLYSINSWLPTLLLDRGFDIRSAYGMSLVKDLAGMIGCFTCGFIITKLGRKKGAIFAYAFAAVSIVVMAFLSGGVMILYIGALFVGYGINLLPTPFNTLSAETYPTKLRAIGNGWMSGFGRFASFLAPLISGVLVGFGLDFTAVMCCFAIPCIIGILLVFVFIKRDTSDTQL